jgi:antitoxin component YwqK of YwqJK toxin-antitoxin module
MKSFLILTLIFFACFHIHAQDTLNKSDAAGKKQGYWIKKDKEGKKIYEGHFNHDIPIGQFKYYYPGGELKAVSFISDSGNRSQTTAYFKNGQKMAQGVYIKEKRDSTWKFFSEFENVVVSEEFYKDGRKEGVSKTFYPDGRVAERMTWSNGIRSGLWETYYTDGKLKLKCAYKNDLKDGPLKTYNMSGKIRLTGQYINGDADGTWIYYTEKGEIEKKEYFSKGLLLKTEELIKAETK